MNPSQVAHGIRTAIMPPEALVAPFQWGYVNAVHTSPNTVDLYLDGTQTLNDTAYLTPGVRYVDTYSPTVGDVVVVLRNIGASATDRVVVGKLA